ncbi:MAG: MtrB/PioB family decaheme-associated outer membrane protein [Gammaproteobacteria bacterium]|nr:MtrB/PioB family decaheme-associated outer membrane protein [Gammaproteobacteria bacterium]
MKRWLLAGGFALVGVAYGDSIVEGEVELGVGYLDESSFRYGKYSGLVDDGLEVIANVAFSSRPVWDSGATRYWRLQGERLGFDSRRVDVEAGDQGSQRLRLSFQETPRNLFEDGQTPFLGTGGQRLTLPAGWEATAASTAAMTTLDENLLDFSQRQRRRDANLDYRLHFADGWRLDASMRRQIRDGRSEMAGTIGTNGGNSRAALLPAPVDYETDTFDLSVVREGQRHLLGMAWHGSFFRNSDRELSWQNPFGPQPQWQPGAAFPDGFGQLALLPDNDFQQLRVFGQLSLTPTTRASLDLARGRMRQDQRFLPYSVDAELAPTALPRADLNGKVDTTLAHLRLNSRPLPRLNLTGRVRYEDRDNKTPQDVFLPVSGDAGLQVAPENGRINRPYGLTRSEIGFDGAYRLPQRTRLNFGYEHRLRKRDFSEVNTAREHVFRGGLRTQRFQAVSLGLDASHERRNTSRYVGNRPLLATRVPGSVDPEAFENHPNLRRYYLADRDRDRIQLRADVHPADNWHLGAAFAWSRDDYREDLFGLDESRLRSWMLDAGYVPTEKVRVSAFYHHDRYASSQRARSFTAAPPTVNDPDRDWSVDTRDTHETWGLSLDLDGLDAGFATTDGSSRSLDLRLDYTDSRSRGQIGVEAGPALAAADLPNLSTRFQVVSLTATQRLSEVARIRFAFEHERYRSRDFALDGVGPASVAQVLLFGEASPRYRANWVTLSYLHRF